MWRQHNERPTKVDTCLTSDGLTMWTIHLFRVLWQEVLLIKQNYYNKLIFNWWWLITRSVRIAHNVSSTRWFKYCIHLSKRLFFFNKFCLFILPFLVSYYFIRLLDHWPWCYWNEPGLTEANKGSLDFTAVSASFSYVVFLSLGNWNRLKCSSKMSIYKFNICLLFMDLNFEEIF